MTDTAPQTPRILTATVPAETPGAGPAPRPCVAWTDQIVGKPLKDEYNAYLPLAFTLATELLWANSGRRFGLNRATVRPTDRNHLGVSAFLQWPWLTSFLADTNWSTWPGFWLLPYPCDHRTGSSVHVEEIDLIQHPVVAVDQVNINGTILDPSCYRIDDWRWLVRTDGATWPTVNDLTQTVIGQGAWGITYTFGSPPPALGVVACGELAREFALALAGADCRLSRRVASVSRQGVNSTFVAIDDLKKFGLTGLDLCDAFLTAYNRHGLPSRARIYRPDATPPRSRTVGT